VDGDGWGVVDVDEAYMWAVDQAGRTLKKRKRGYGERVVSARAFMPLSADGDLATGRRVGEKRMGGAYSRASVTSVSVRGKSKSKSKSTSTSKATRSDSASTKLVV
jgi:hypothetical protein